MQTDIFSKIYQIFDCGSLVKNDLIFCEYLFFCGKKNVSCFRTKEYPVLRKKLRHNNIFLHSNEPDIEISLYLCKKV
jgi:hypothetical protein